MLLVILWVVEFNVRVIGLSQKIANTLLILLKVIGAAFGTSCNSEVLN
jgi:hypothetical protein